MQRDGKFDRTQPCDAYDTVQIPTHIKVAVLVLQIAVLYSCGWIQALVKLTAYNDNELIGIAPSPRGGVDETTKASDACVDVVKQLLPDTSADDWPAGGGRPITRVAKALGIVQPVFSNVISVKNGISPDTDKTQMRR